jgi:hypothetical protein
MNPTAERTKQSELNFHFQMTKGRLAETIIEEMFLSCGYEVHRFGMENMVPGLVRKLRNNSGSVSTQIKRMPDFIMQKENDIHFVEVKYKSDGCFDRNDLEKDNKAYPYEDCLLILVSRDKIKCLSVKELRENKRITPECTNYLGYRKEFSLDRGVINDYLRIVDIFFSQIPAKL